MKVSDLPLEGLKLIELKIFYDDRGFFMESYQEERFSKLGLTNRFVQDNCSRSTPGVIRGLHYQTNPNQGKLVGVIRGKVWDVVVDIRAKSPTFGKWFGIELNDLEGKLLWVPPGFAHGFCAHGNEDASVMYKVDQFYSPTGEGGIRFDDPELGIKWPTERKPIVSDKDRALPTFAEYARKPVF